MQWSAPLIVDSFRRLQQNRILFDHLVGAREQCWWNCDAKRLGGSQVDHEFVFRRCLDGQFGGFLAFENAVDICSRASVLIDCIRSIRHQAPIHGVIPIWINRGQPKPLSNRNDRLAICCRSARRNNYAAICRASKCRKSALHLTDIARIDWGQLYSERRCYRLSRSELSGPWASRRIPDHGNAANMRCNLLEQLKPFSGKTILVLDEAGDVAAWPRQAFDEARSNRVNGLHKNNWDNAAGSSIVGAITTVPEVRITSGRSAASSLAYS